MARSRRSSPASSSARKPAPAAPAKAPAPAPAAPAPAPAPAAQPSSGGMMSGLMGTVAEGMAWGTGTAIARHAVNAVVDSFSGDSKEAPAAAAPVAAAPAAAAPANACFNDQKAFMDCLNANKNDISSCQLYLDAFNSCKQQSTFL